MSILHNIMPFRNLSLGAFAPICTNCARNKIFDKDQILS